MPTNRPTLVRLLGDTLGEVIAEQEGEDVRALVERVRSLSIRAAAGEQEAADEVARNSDVAATTAQNIARYTKNEIFNSHPRFPT